MRRTVLGIWSLSLVVLAACEWDGDLGTGPTCGSGCGGMLPTGPSHTSSDTAYTDVWIETETTGDTTGIGDHDLLVKSGERPEWSMDIPLNASVLHRYTDANTSNWAGEGPRSATLSPGSSRCSVTSENPQHFTVSFDGQNEKTLQFTIRC